MHISVLSVYKVNLNDFQSLLLSLYISDVLEYR